MNIILLALIWLLVNNTGSALATAQQPDILWYQGQEYPLFTNPLESYFGEDNPRPNFKSPHTANWRGYVATWEIEGGVLYLKKIEGWVNGAKVGLEQLFPGHKGRVKASWFTGRLRVPQGKLLSYMHMGYGSIYEKDLIVTLEGGKVVKEEVIDNKSKFPKTP